MSATISPQCGGDFGDYRIDSVLGRGAMGVVYRAWQRRMNRAVALKVLPADLAQDPVYRARFAREAAALAQLDSPHVIQIYDHGEVDGNLYLAMQLVQGPDLGRVLAGGALPPQRALRIAAQVAAALGDGHAVGVVHRDVKPSNVLLRPLAEHDDAAHDDRDFVYLCDFGIARSAADIASGPETAGVVGTLGYIAPERLRGQPASPASDVYSWGCLLWALLIGSAPFQGSQPQVMMGHLEAPVPQLDGADRRTGMVNALLAASLAKEPGQRPTIGTVRRQIRDVLAEPPSRTVPAARPAPTIPMRSGARLSRRARLIAAVVVVVLLAGGVLGWTLLIDPARSAPGRIAQAEPIGVTCQESAVGGADADAGVLAMTVCDAGPDVGGLRLVALRNGDAFDPYLRSGAGQAPEALLAGSCPRELPTRQRWQGDGHHGTLLCFVLGQNTRYAWTFDDLAVVAVLDGRPQVPFPRDLEPVAAFFAGARYR